MLRRVANGCCAAVACGARRQLLLLMPGAPKPLGAPAALLRAQQFMRCANHVPVVGCNAKAAAPASTATSSALRTRSTVTLPALAAAV